MPKDAEQGRREKGSYSQWAAACGIGVWGLRPRDMGSTHVLIALDMCVCVCVGEHISSVEIVCVFTKRGQFMGTNCGRGELHLAALATIVTTVQYRVTPQCFPRRRTLSPQDTL